MKSRAGRIGRGTAVVLVCAALLPVRGAAQVLGGGALYERYAFDTPAALDIESLTMASVPFGATYRTGGLVLGLAGSFARASLVRSDGVEATVSGLSDTQLTAGWATAGGGAALTAIVRVPTGRQSLTYEEMFVAGAIAADVLPFRTRDFGTGGGAGASVSLARPFGKFAAALSVGYVVAREYEPLSEEDFAYRPGDQLHVRAAVDRTIGRSAKVALRADWRRHGTDEGDGANVFEPGNRVQIVGSYDFAVGRSAAITYIGWLKRGEGRYVSPPDMLAAQSLVFAGAGIRVPVAGMVLVPSADLRVLESDGADRRGYTAGFGASLEGGIGGALVIPDARLRFGHAQAADGAETGYTGVSVGVQIRFGGNTR